ncbi:MAG: type II toxin-antitoxin system PemK/MazF family toxin [Ornithinimicrobium sp.]
MTNPTEIPLLRNQIDDERHTGLTKPSRIMVDKVTTVPRATMGERIGVVSDTTMLALSGNLVVFLGVTWRRRLGARDPSWR